MKKRVVVRAQFASAGGYGHVGLMVAKAILKLGHELQAIPLGGGGTVPKEVAECFVHKTQRDTHEIVIYNPYFESPKDKKRRILLTMWEVDRVPVQIVKNLNTNYVGIIVPSYYCQEVFAKNGVKIPTVVVPLEVNTEIFKPVEKFPKNVVFGTAGKLANGGQRKGILEVIKAFQQAFPIEADVFLRVKVTPECEIPPIWDTRIQLLKAILDEPAMVEWYQSLSAYVSGATCEGWGLHQHEAMACGKPLVSINYGGVKSFFRPEINGYSVNYKLQPNTFTHYFGDKGRWAVPDLKSLSEQLRNIYQNPVQAFLRGQNARVWATKFNDMAPWFDRALKIFDII